MTGHAVGQHEDIGYVVQAQYQGSQAQQHAYVEEVLPQVRCRVQNHLPASEEHHTSVEYDEQDGRTGIRPHALPLQEGWHGDAERVDGLQIAHGHQIEHHERVHRIGLRGAYDGAEEGGSHQ